MRDRSVLASAGLAKTNLVAINVKGVADTSAQTRGGKENQIRTPTAH